jgi:hypothetical protein
MTRTGDWIQTYTGNQFYPLDPRPEDINILDIAHALSNQCRFSGHCKHFYSVAQHSVLVSRYVPTEYALWGLLHDASEAYLVDLPRPLKNHSKLGYEYKLAESNLMLVIAECFGLTVDIPEIVMQTDLSLLMTEAKCLMGTPPADWMIDAEPLDIPIDPWEPHDAEIMFLARWDFLTRQTSP